MELEKIEEALRGMVASLDKGVRLEALQQEDDRFRAVLAKGNHSDRATLERELLEEFAGAGQRGPEIKKIIGKVISKLNRLAQGRR